MRIDRAEAGLCLRFPATAAAVRATLLHLFDPPAPRLSLSEDHAATAQLVLAEVLNNIVEHAYARYPGDIVLTCQMGEGRLWVRVVDDGCPLPDAARAPHGPIAFAQDLREGGYGWFLIRSLTQDLTYRRDAGQNVLSFGVDP